MNQNQLEKSLNDRKGPQPFSYQFIYDNVDKFTKTFSIVNNFIIQDFLHFNVFILFFMRKRYIPTNILKFQNFLMTMLC